MKKRFLSFTALLVTAVMVLGGCGSFGSAIIQGSGPIVSRTFDVGSFDSIDMGGARTVIFREAPVHSVTIEMHENLFDHMELEVRGGTLRHVSQGMNIGFNFNNHSPRIYVYAPTITGLNLSGASTAEDWDVIHAPSFSITVSGASNVEIELYVDVLDIDLSGASRVRLSGVAPSATMTASGASNIFAENMQTVSADLDLSGASRANVAVSDDLSVNASGASNVSYIGNPSVNSSLSGASSVDRVN
ncbi:MAG: DUF2807 domain-containing protein [Defluviitaleaceae bacterium]|nr:DUF2807 domain-containing protein [Defluviitaleaceae bacterium]